MTGDATRAYDRMDLAALEVSTRSNGKVIKHGKGTHAVGNPLHLLAWPAHHARTRGGIPAGTVATTGAWLGLHPVAPGDEVTVEFPAIGSARVAHER